MMDGIGDGEIFEWINGWGNEWNGNGMAHGGSGIWIRSYESGQVKHIA